MACTKLKRQILHNFGLFQVFLLASPRDNHVSNRCL